MNQVADVLEGRCERGQRFKYIEELRWEKAGLENYFYVILEFPRWPRCQLAQEEPYTRPQ